MVACDESGNRTSSRARVIRPARAVIIVTWSLSEQAHVPAEQSAPGTDAWFPAAHAHPGRPCHPGGPQAQGPREAECLILPPQSRMRRSAEFLLAMRAGDRAGRPSLVGYLLVRPDAGPVREPARVGFVVSRAVGSAVTRNRVKRRLRALVRGYLQLLPGGSLLVVRANAAAAHASQAGLAADLDLVISRLLRRQVGARVGNGR
jgi:ribonuclease P protein component